MSPLSQVLITMPQGEVRIQLRLSLAPQLQLLLCIELRAVQSANTAQANLKLAAFRLRMFFALFLRTSIRLLC
jgi:hypothetical protein